MRARRFIRKAIAELFSCNADTVGIVKRGKHIRLQLFDAVFVLRDLLRESGFLLFQICNLGLHIEYGNSHKNAEHDNGDLDKQIAFTAARRLRFLFQRDDGLLRLFPLLLCKHSAHPPAAFGGCRHIKIRLPQAPQ